MPKAEQILASEGTLGTMFFRYQDEIEDCGRTELSAN